MKIYLAIIIFSGFAITISAQKQDEWPDTIYSVKDLYTLKVPAIDLTKATVVDTAVLSVTYRFQYQIGSDAPKKSAWMILDIGRSVVRFYNDDYFRKDSIFTYKFKDMTPSYSCESVPCEELFSEIGSCKMMVFNRLPGGDAELIAYEEPLPQIDWDVSETESRLISRYACRSAEGTFGGRKWKVWFTTDIPLAYGPWKLAGLPGIILEAAESTGSYRFECIRISTYPKPIKQYDSRCREMQKTAWRKLERRVYQAPIEQLGKNGKVQYVYKMKVLDETWSIPYDPIERE